MGKGLLKRRVLLVAVTCTLALLALGTGTALGAAATTGPANGIGTTVATLHGTVDAAPGATWYFQWGKSPTLTNSTSSQVFVGPPPQDVSKQITGLTPGTQYSYRLVVVPLYQPKQYGAIRKFFTTAKGQRLATTGTATSVTQHSATLNGITNTNNDVSHWWFQYGTTTAYGSSTSHSNVVGPGFTAVSLTVHGLKPSTRYHFRLVVQPGSYPAPLAFGQDKTFKTPPPYGHTSLLSHRLKVHDGFVSVPFSCSGQAGARCTGKLAITSRGKVGGRMTTVRCGSRSFAFGVTSRKVVKARIGSGCAKLLRKAKHHQITGSLKATFPKQRELQASVTLFRK